jgi:glutamyl/glutaminyl-tRNA synthetase
MPLFWHLPMLCNTEGKKLSKRDFGFSLGDIRNAGFLPQALLNYLAISGGGMFKQEIMSMDELIHGFDFTALSATGQVQYDIEKLKWVNHKWIERLSASELANRVYPFLQVAYPQESTLISEDALIKVVDFMRSDIQVLQDASAVLEFYFKKPMVTGDTLKFFIPAEYIQSIQASVEQALSMLHHPEQFIQMLKADLESKNIAMKYGFFYVRMALTGKPHGPALGPLIAILGIEESEQRIKRVDWAVDAQR